MPKRSTPSLTLLNGQKKISANTRKKRSRSNLRSRLRQIRTLLLDCDGVLTPGDLIYDENGKRFLRFYSRDGLGLSLWRYSGYQIGILSGRPTNVVERRLRELGVRHFKGECRKKGAGVLALCQSMQVDPSQCAFVGDDILDIPALKACGVGIAVADAAPELKQHADWITKKSGGFGAVREVCETILKAQGHWEKWLERLISEDDIPDSP